MDDDLSTDEVVAGFRYSAIKELVEFVEQNVVRAVSGHQGDKQQTAMSSMYLSMHRRALGLCRLDSPTYFETAAPIARGMFEILVDLELIHTEPQYVERYLAFPGIDRHSATESALKRSKQPDSGLNEAYIRERLKSLEGAVAKWTEKWGKPPPHHWFDRNVEARIKLIRKRDPVLGSQLLDDYAITFKPLSWQVHPVPTGYLETDDGIAAFVVGLAYQLAFKFFYHATRAITTALGIDRTIPHYADLLVGGSLHTKAIMLPEWAKAMRK